MVNPLTVSVPASGKKRLILDLREVNKHVWKEKVKYEDKKVALAFLERGLSHDLIQYNKRVSFPGYQRHTFSRF